VAGAARYSRCAARSAVPLRFPRSPVWSVPPLNFAPRLLVQSVPLQCVSGLVPSCLRQRSRSRAVVFPTSPSCLSGGEVGKMEAARSERIGAGRRGTETETYCTMPALLGIVQYGQCADSARGLCALSNLSAIWRLGYLKHYHRSYFDEMSLSNHKRGHVVLSDGRTVNSLTAAPFPGSQ
jgi:hypothetical protein